MKFTGKNLQLVHAALVHAVSDINMTIGQCPDVVEYADDIAEYETQRNQFEALRARVDAAIKKEES